MVPWVNASLPLSDISIDSAVFAGFTVVTNTDRQTERRTTLRRDTVAIARI